MHDTIMAWIVVLWFTCFGVGTWVCYCTHDRVRSELVRKIFLFPVFITLYIGMVIVVLKTFGVMK